MKIKSRITVNNETSSATLEIRCVDPDGYPHKEVFICPSGPDCYNPMTCDYAEALASIITVVDDGVHSDKITIVTVDEKAARKLLLATYNRLEKIVAEYHQKFTVMEFEYNIYED